MWKSTHNFFFLIVTFRDIFEDVFGSCGIIRLTFFFNYRTKEELLQLGACDEGQQKLRAVAALALLSAPLSSPRSATQTNCTVLGAQCKMEIWYPSSKLQNEGGNSRTLNQAWIPWERWLPCDGPGHIPLKQPKTEVTASQFPDQSLADEMWVGKGIMVLRGGTEELMCGLQSLPSPFLPLPQLRGVLI